jgi:predicted dehydrogenase
MNVGIIGFGRMGQRRAASLAGCNLVATADNGDDWGRVINRRDIDIVIVSTPHDLLARATAVALQAGKHVLVEKPAADSVSDLEEMIRVAKLTGGLVRVGFNHRYCRAFRKARELLPEIAPLMHVRGRYGHGGRPGYDREWRAKAVRGGGELIDQGVHLIDLARWFLGDFVDVQGMVETCYWDMEVEDNGWLLLRTSTEKVAQLHVSCTEWGKMFSFELFGKNGKIEISGLGSCGTELLRFYDRLNSWSTIWEWQSPDDSLEFEMAEFLEDIRLNRQPTPGLHDALEALKVVEKVRGKR